MTRGPLARAVRTLFVVLAVGVVVDIAYVLTTSDRPILADLHHANVLCVLAAAAMIMVAPLLHAVRITLWSRVFKHPLKFRQSLSAVACNEIGAAITPTGSGGGYLKLLFLTTCGFTTAQATATMVLGSLEDLLFVLIVVPALFFSNQSYDDDRVAVAFSRFYDNLTSAGAIIVVVLIVALIAHRLIKCKRGAPVESTFRWQRLRERLRTLRREVFEAGRVAATNGRGTFALGAVLSTVGWCCRYASVVLLFAAFGLQIDFLLLPFLHWVVFNLTTIVPSPGAIGGAEFMFVSILGGFIPESLQPVIVSLWRGLTFYMGILLATVFLSVTGLIGLLRDRVAGSDKTPSPSAAQIPGHEVSTP